MNRIPFIALDIQLDDAQVSDEQINALLDLDDHAAWERLFDDLHSPGGTSSDSTSASKPAT